MRLILVGALAVILAFIGGVASAVVFFMGFSELSYIRQMRLLGFGLLPA